MKFGQSEVQLLKGLPSSGLVSTKQSVIFYDKILLKNPAFKQWIKKYPFKIELKSGESLKSFAQFKKISEMLVVMSEKIAARPLQFVAVGGGSIGDFVGFIASVFKRGVPLIHIPSTYLAAIDSAHGGKNALNIEIGKRRFKNQIGTFYPASKIIISKSILSTLPEEIIIDSYGEALKISLLKGGKLWQKFSSQIDWDHQIIWQLLPDLIRAKYEIVSKDPFEKKGVRHLLNFGHSLGHVIESDLKISHGLSVLLGLGFALEWSRSRGLYKKQVISLPDHRRALSKLKNTENLLKQDKKMTGNSQIRFIFLKSPGHPVIEKVKIKEIVAEVKRQFKA